MGPRGGHHAGVTCVLSTGPSRPALPHRPRSSPDTTAQGCGHHQTLGMRRSDRAPHCVHVAPWDCAPHRGRWVCGERTWTAGVGSLSLPAHPAHGNCSGTVLPAGPGHRPPGCPVSLLTVPRSWAPAVPNTLPTSDHSMNSTHQADGWGGHPGHARCPVSAPPPGLPQGALSRLLHFPGQLWAPGPWTWGSVTGR